MSAVSPFLCIKITEAFFQLLGSLPSLRHVLNMIYDATNLFVVRVVERAVQLGQVCAGTVSRRGRHWSDSQEGDVVIGRQKESVGWGRL